jgi:hypothetical protein
MRTWSFGTSVGYQRKASEAKGGVGCQTTQEGTETNDDNKDFEEEETNDDNKDFEEEEVAL